MDYTDDNLDELWNKFMEARQTPQFDLDAEIDRQRALGYETFDDYIARTGFPRDEASYVAFIGEGRWMLTSKDK